ncbi:error-prone DNA polymerase, DnaE-like [Andreprevotia lacus DSM 23236]|jgi:error-prone DNA polymerase|uniref:Error-prone DNA polymerase n=1 Tax=Andreprevotia lacus DSM 23236 TaxID=1121001 RepID=A0A1W1XFQ7_9NEIS|nr:error-prone DNA polymerase [Andreprevotia lacus]SMC22793.1 error-prone DNA polymerase, DnaE-like [Andreprevotia lacus DSM 23236]
MDGIAISAQAALPTPVVPPDYAELHCLSNFSFQRGASHAEELVERAHQLGYRALAITDECSLAGMVRAHRAAKELGLHLIVGAEFTLDDGLRLVLLAPERQAYGDLAELITRGRRNADKGSYRLGRSDVADFAGQLLAIWLPPDQPDVADGLWLARHFAGRCWIAAELLLGPDDAGRLRQLQWLAGECGLPLLAAGDVHMHQRDRQPLQDVLTAVRLGKPVAQCGTALFGNSERHLRTRQRLATLYPIELLAETVRVAERCTFSLDELRYEYPDEFVPPQLTPIAYLSQLTEAGLRERYPDGTPPKVREQVDKELALIAEKGYEAYFLTVEDIVRYARSQGILCQGRGSAANSAVCYALGITAVDPAISNLLFERFVSSERDEPPDIDVDFEHDRREEVIQYVYRKYGRDRAALAATVITYRTKSALRDVGRALGLSEDQLDRLTRSLAWWDNKDELAQRMLEAGLEPDSRPVRQLLSLVGTLRRFPRHLSQHVGGLVISRGSLQRLVPIENAAMAERTVIEWDKDDLDTVGLLKVDVLALGMLSALRRTMALVSALRQRPLTLHTVPSEDPAVYEMLSRADSVGVFQVESRAQMSMLPRLKPRCFYDLVIEVAIVRPGPIQGGMVHPYLRRKQGLEPVEYPHDDVRAVLERTLGVPLFQEQVMQLAVVAGGFTAGEADQLRRSMAAWRRTGRIDIYRDKLISGMLERKYPLEFAERIFKQIEGFAEYGFPESHAASFAKLVYVSAWLKRHEPAAFLCGLLNSLPMGFYSASQLIQDARRHGIEVRPVDVQCSEWDCTLEDNGQPQPAVRLGFNLVKGMAEAAGRQIARQRPATGYASVAQLQQLAQLDPRMLTALTEADALATLAGHRRQAWWRVSGLDTQADLARAAAPAEVDQPALPPVTLGQDVVFDYRALGLSLRAHPLSLLRTQLAAERLLTAADIARAPNGRIVRVAGLVVGRQRPGTATGVVFVTLEDETGNTNVIVWNDLVERQRRELLGSQLLAVYGIVQREGRVVNVLAKRLVDKTALLGELQVRSRDFH